MTKSPTNRLDRPTRDSQVISRILSLRRNCRELRALRPPARPCKSSGVSHAAGPNAEGGPGCAAHRAPPVTRHIGRLCDTYGKCCELQMSDAQCKCNGYCGQRREISISLCCRSCFSMRSTGPSLLQSLVFRKGVIRLCPALRSCRRTNQSSNYFLQDH